MTWITPLTLEMPGIRLEPLAPHHEAGLREAARDGELWSLHYTSVPRPEDTPAYIETALRQCEAGYRLAFAVIDTASGDVLGSTGYHDIQPELRRLDIGYTWYARRVQRSHVNTTCKLMLLQHAFDDCNADAVGWRTDILNQTSQRAIERLGARKDGVIRHHALRRDGSVRDTVMYSLLHSEWPEVRHSLQERLAQARPDDRQG